MKSPNSDTLPITHDEFVLFRDYIHENCGIIFEENKMYLMQNRLSVRLKELGMTNYRDYYYHVKYDHSREEFNNLINVITTNETSFFRNEPQLNSFANDILPKVINEKKLSTDNRSLRIWSAGCSSGEEPYTLAMVIIEHLKSFNFLDVQIFANDISHDVLNKARKGEYLGHTLRNVKPEWLKKYFIKENNKYRVISEIKSIVNFSHLNLANDNQLNLLHNIDIIFCRNVMIYFSKESKKKLVRKFFNILRPGGYLYLGHSETLHGVSKAFKLIFYKNCLTYKKDRHDYPVSQKIEKERISKELKNKDNVEIELPKSKIFNG